MKSLFSRIISFLFPEACVVCGKENTSLCTNCLQSFSPSSYQEESWMQSLFSYQDHRVRKAIHAFKFKHVRSIADSFAPSMHETIQESMAQTIILKQNTPITLLSVPRMSSHIQKRGFDAVMYLCEKIQVQDPTSYHICTDAIVRTNTKAQVGLTRKERLVNMKNGFRLLNKESICNQLIYIIDDVVTTGSTLRELRKVCLEAGAKGVYAVTIAH